MGMKMLVLLIGKNVLEQLRDIKRNSLFFILPMAIFLCFYGYFYMNKVEMTFIKPITVGVIVEEESIYGQAIVDDFYRKKDLTNFFRIEQGTRKNMELAFEHEDIDALVTIPKGFIKSMMYFGDLPIDVIIRNEDPIKTMIIYQSFKSYGRYIGSVEKGITALNLVLKPKVEESLYWEYNDALSVELIMTVLNRNELYEFIPIVDIPSTLSVEYFFISIMTMFIFYLSLILSLRFYEEVKSHSFSRLLLTHCGLRTYLFAKFMSQVIMLSITIGLWILIYTFIVKNELYANRLHVFIFLVIVICLSVLMAMLLVLVIKNEQEMLMFTSVYVFFSAILGGSIIPLQYMPEGLQFLSKWTPNYYVIRHILYLRHDIQTQGMWLFEMMGLCFVPLMFIVIKRRLSSMVKGGFL